MLSGRHMRIAGCPPDRSDTQLRCREDVSRMLLRRVALIRILHGDGHDGTGLQVHRVLRLVRQVRPPVFHLRDFGVGIEGMGPIVVRAFLRPLAIDPRQVLARGRLYTGRLGELRQTFLVSRARVASHDAAQGGVRLQCRRVNTSLVLDQSGVGELLQNPREDGFVGLQIDQTARARNPSMSEPFCNAGHERGR